MQPSIELRELVLQTYAAMANGDTTFYDQHLSRQEGVLIIGSDPNEWWAGRETILRVYEAQMQEVGGIGVVGYDPLAYSEGNVGWVADRPSFRLPDGTQVPFRSTIVFEKEDDLWKVVHQHISIGVPNDSVI
jgi:ketosteroid isomerase-like protein